MSAKHTTTAKPGKHPDWPAIPLRGHGNGKWYIKTKRRYYYFGRWDDPAGAAGEYEEAAHLVKAGLSLNQLPAPSSIPLDVVADRFLSYQEARVGEGAGTVDKEDAEGEIGFGQYDDYRRTLVGSNPKKVTAGFVGFIGAKVPAERVTHERLLDYRRHLRKTLRAHTANRMMMWVRAMFRWANRKAKIIRTTQYEDDALRPVSAKRVRKEQRLHEEKHGAPVFGRRDCVRLLANAAPGSALEVAILLALNCGYGQRDLAALRISRVDLDKGHIRYIRRKVEIRRQATLWPETIEAIHEYLTKRRKPVDAKDADILLVTRFGRRYWRQTVETNEAGGIGRVVISDGFRQEFNKLMKRLGIHKKGRGFYSLRRTFASFADQVADKNAKRRIMGHQMDGMDPHYVRMMPRRRLRKITNYVRHQILVKHLKPKPGTDNPPAFSPAERPEESSPAGKP